MFLALRHAAIGAMAGRKWTDGRVDLDLTYWAPQPRPATDPAYPGGVMDTLGGSHGRTFIYLPIVYLDDCQTAVIRVAPKVSEVEHYRLVVSFLD